MGLSGGQIGHAALVDIDSNIGDSFSDIDDLGDKSVLVDCNYESKI